MRQTMLLRLALLFWGLVLSLLLRAEGTLQEVTLTSEILTDSRVSINPQRRIKVYLPPGYQDSDKAYPVVYYLHSSFYDNQRLFASGDVKRTLDRGIEQGVIREFILVAADYTSTSASGSLFENNTSTGRWLDYTTDEVVPFIDTQYRTIASSDARAVVGDFFGGYGALKLAMLNPDLFGQVYALHPVATGLGYIPMARRPDWQAIFNAQNVEELEGQGFSFMFTLLYQAYLPNPDNPPLYTDTIMDKTEAGFEVNVERSARFLNSFLLENLVFEHADKMRQLRGIKFDWARYDTNQDHVLANQRFSRLLDDFGIEHEAEEYRGELHVNNWREYGRVYDDVLPFLNRYLRFDP